MSNKVTTPYPLFSDIDGSPLIAGFLFFGESGKDAKQFPISVYWDEAKTLLATQPISVRNGLIVKDNVPSAIFIEELSYSVVINDRNNYLIRQLPSFDQLSTAKGVKALVDAERLRAATAEQNLDSKITLEKNRALAAEQNLQLQITTSANGIKYFETEAQLLAFVPGETDPKQAYAFDTKKNYLWNAATNSWKDEGYSQLEIANNFTKQKTGALAEQFIDSDWYYSRFALKDINFQSVDGLLGLAFGGTYSKIINNIETYLHLRSGTSKVILKCYSRNKDTLDDLPETANDILQFTIEKPITDFAVKNGWVLARFDFNKIIDTTKPVLFVITAVDASNSPTYPIGFTTCSTLPKSSFSSGSELGYYKSTQYGWSTLENGISFKLGFEKPEQVINLKKETQAVVSTSDKSFTFNADYAAWLVGFPTITSYFNAIESEFRIKLGTKKVLCQIVARRLTDANSTEEPPNISTDKLIAYAEQSIDTAFSGDKTFLFEFDPDLVPSGYFVVAKFIAFTASNTAQNLGITVQVNSGATYPVQVGAYNDGSGWNWLLPSNSWKVGATLIDAKKIELNTEIDSINAELDSISQTLSNVDVSDKTIYLPSLNATSSGLVATISGSFNIFTQVRTLSTSTSHDACNTGSTTVSSSLKKTTVFGPWVTNPNAWLGYHWLSNVVVKRTDTNVTLSEGVDYEVDYFGGKLYSYNLDNISVSVTFNYKKERYDLIQYNLVNNTVNVKKGTERIHDAQEYMPAPDNGGWKGLFTVLVVGNEIKGIQPIYKTNGIGGDFYKMPAELATIKYHNAKCLRKTKLKLQNSDPLKIVGWGDSITAINGGSDTTSPNGNRDLLSYPMTNLPRETVELYTAITSDSFGEHVKIGWNWYLKSLFETKFGSTVTYLNYGLSGMGSGQGVDPVNIANINANNTDLIVMCWGMNDQLSTDTYPNLINIAKQFIANGSEVVIMPVPRTPKINNITPILGTETDYNTNLLRCYQAALESGAAFVPAHLYVGYNSDNSIGLHSMHYCSSNLVNHPGLFELKIYGKLLCSLFD